MALTVKTKDWKAGRRWAKRNAFATPGVTYTIVRDGRHLSYRYEDGLMYFFSRSEEHTSELQSQR